MSQRYVKGADEWHKVDEDASVGAKIAGKKQCLVANCGAKILALAPITTTAPSEDDLCSGCSRDLPDWLKQKLSQ